MKVVWDWQRIIRSSDLDANAKHVGITLSTRMDKDGHAFPSVATLAADTSRHRDTVRKALAELVDEGLLRIERPSRRAPTHYYLVLREDDSVGHLEVDQVGHSTTPTDPSGRTGQGEWPTGSARVAYTDRTEGVQEGTMEGKPRGPQATEVIKALESRLARLDAANAARLRADPGRARSVLRVAVMDALEDGVTSNALIKEVLEPSLGSATCVAAALASRVREATAKRSGRGIDSAIERAPQLAGAPTSAGTPPEGISNGRS